MAPVSRYHPLLVLLHWVLAFFIIAALGLGALVMVKIPNTDAMKLDYNLRLAKLDERRPVFGFGGQPAQAFATIKQGGFYRCGTARG